MALTGNGTSSTIKPAAAIATMATPSFHFHYRNAAIPGSAVIDCAFSLQSDPNDYQINFTWDNTTAGGVKACNVREAGGTVRRAQMTSSPAADTWHRIGGSYDGVNANVVYNGAIEASTACATMATADPVPCALAAVAGTFDFDDGTIAEIGVWNVALAAADWYALGLGVSPELVRPDALVLYWKLIRLGEVARGAAITLTNTTVAAHPAIIYASNSNRLVGLYDDPYDAAEDKSGSVEDALTVADTDGDETTVSEEEEIEDEFTSGDNRGDTSDDLVVADKFLSNSGYLAGIRVRNRSGK